MTLSADRTVEAILTGLQMQETDQQSILGYVAEEAIMKLLFKLSGISK